MAAVGLNFNVFCYDAVWATHRGRGCEHRAEPKLNAEYRASGTDSKSTTAEHRTHNLSVPSGYATCYATKILFTEYRYVKSDLVDFTTLRDFTYIHMSFPISIASMGVTF